MTVGKITSNPFEMENYLHRCFADEWRGKPALCFLFGEGPGPDGEAVRIVGRSTKSGLCIYYAHSYEKLQGNAARAYRFLKERFGRLEAREVRSEEGKAFHRRMLDLGVIADFTN